MLGTGAQNSVHDTNTIPHRGRGGSRTSTDNGNCLYRYVPCFKTDFFFLNCSVIIPFNTVLAMNISWHYSNRTLMLKRNCYLRKRGLYLFAPVHTFVCWLVSLVGLQDLAKMDFHETW